MDYSFLKSGSDIRGTANNALGGVVDLDKRAVCTIVDAFVFWLAQKKQNNKLKIAVGMDSRTTSKEIQGFVVTALKYAGCAIYDCGLASTPAMYMMTILPEIQCDGAIMITASHLPKDKNGLKFFVASGGLSGAEIDTVLAYARDEKCIEDTTSQLFQKDFMGAYCNYLIGRARQMGGQDYPYQGLRIAVDASNGVGGFFASKVLNALGAEIGGSQFLEPNGEFPNHIPNPEDRGAMESICTCVKRVGADIGVIFDTDADRVALVDKNGNPIHRNALIALVSAILLKEEKGYIITDSTTSEGLSKFIAAHGGKHHRYKRGYQNVIGEAKQFLQNNMNALVAIETSGHAALKENYFLDDGSYLALRVIDTLAKIKKEGKDLADLLQGLQQPAESIEVRVKITATDYKAHGNNILAAMTEWAKRDLKLDGISYEGVRAKCEAYGGWFLARLSLHEPILAFNMESDMVGGVKNIVQMLYNRLVQIEGIDASNFLQYLG
ncbi:MAG: phosphomannomutase/phosphoglucomutase [Firmicutes bacterium]|nr:phosphomannomutase/phosphoglucomutase [Bacillota bacterium]